MAAEAERIDHVWTLLHANDPEAVTHVLSAAFEDNEAPTAAVAVQGTEVYLVVLVPPESVIPDRQPSTTTQAICRSRR